MPPGRSARFRWSIRRGWNHMLPPCCLRSFSISINPNYRKHWWRTLVSINNEWLNQLLPISVFPLPCSHHHRSVGLGMSGRGGTEDARIHLQVVHIVAQHTWQRGERFQLSRHVQHDQRQSLGCHLGLYLFLWCRRLLESSGRRSEGHVQWGMGSKQCCCLFIFTLKLIQPIDTARREEPGGRG